MKPSTITNPPGMLSVLLVSMALLTSCSVLKEDSQLSRNDGNFFGLSKVIADELVAGDKGNLNKNGRIILTTFVNLNDLYRTSAFGRSMTEALSTELFRQGYKTLEIRKTPEIYVKNGKGELALSRDASVLARQHNARAILTGTYSLTPTTVILNVKILSAFSKDVLSVAALEIKRTDNIDYLLTKNKETTIGQISAYER